MLASIPASILNHNPAKNGIPRFELAMNRSKGRGAWKSTTPIPDGQTLLLWHPEVEPRDGAYVRPAIRLESGAKSALDPHGPLTITPYVAGDAAGIDLAVPDVTTIEATRTFWDKVVIAHGLRRWYERRGELRQAGQRVRGITTTCTVSCSHARMFCDRADYDLASAVPGTFAIEPAPKMVDALARDYANTTAMIFGVAPSFDGILASARQIERDINNRGLGGCVVVDRSLPWSQVRSQGPARDRFGQAQIHATTNA